MIRSKEDQNKNLKGLCHYFDKILSNEDLSDVSGSREGSEVISDMEVLWTQA